MAYALKNETSIACGKICLVFENVPIKATIKINCLLCEDTFYGFQEYTNHLLLKHYPETELEDLLTLRNIQDIKAEHIFERRQSNENETTNEMINFIQKDLKSDAEFFSDFNTLTELNTEVYRNSVPEMDDLLLGKHNVSKATAEEPKREITKNKKCPYCDRNFYLASSLHHHLGMHRSAGDSTGELYKCNVCKSGFYLKFAWLLHMEEHEKKLQTIQTGNKQKLQIPRDKRYSKKSTSGKISSVFPAATATENKRVILDIERRQSPIFNNTSDRSNVSENGDTEELHCIICNKKFCGQVRYKLHMKRHTPCKFKCLTCSKEFKTAGELQTHTRFHTGERTYLCSSCGETFATLSKLINHTRRHHTFERKKECEICKKKFFASGELKVHQQSTHSDERPYKCNLCPSTFNRPFSLRTHMKCHENKREYKCNLCSASFNQKCNLTAHKNKSHLLLTDQEKKV